MDLLKNFKSGDKNRHTAQSSDAAKVPSVKQRKDPSLLDKITGSLGGDHYRHQEQNSETLEHGLDHRLLDQLSGKHEPSQVVQASNKHGLFDEIASALSSQHSGSQTTTPPIAAPKHEVLLDKFSSALAYHEVPPAPVVAPDPPKHEHLLDKVSNMLSGEHHQPPQPIPVTVPPKAEGIVEKLVHHHNEPSVVPSPSPPTQEGMLAKLTHHDVKPDTPPPEPPKHAGILDKFTHHSLVQPPSTTDSNSHHQNVLDKLIKQHDQPAATPEPKHDGLLDKFGLHNKPDAPPLTERPLIERLGKALHHQASVRPPKEETLLDKLEHTIHPTPPKNESLGDKVKTALGLGEEKEDHVDKGIDFVQEHILRQGTQSSESLLEQLKDKQIKKAIESEYKHVTGHELGHDKKHR